MSISETPGYPARASENEWKKVKIIVGGGSNAKTIWDLFSGKGTDKLQNYFAPNIDECLFLDNDVGVSFKVSSKYVSVLEQMMKKFKDSTIGRAASLIQKLSDFAAGLDAASVQKGIASGKITGRSVLSNLRVLPANVRYQTKFQNLPAWDSTGPIELGSFTFRFYLGIAGLYDGRTEVYNPALAMSKINQPSQVASGLLQGPLPNTAWVYGVIGKAVATSVSGAIINTGGNFLNAAATSISSVPFEEAYPKPVATSGGVAYTTRYIKTTVKQGGYTITPNTAYAVYGGSETTKAAISAAVAADTAAWNAQKVEYEKKQKEAAVTVPTDPAGALSSQVEKTLNTYMAGYENALARAIDAWPGTGLVQIRIGRFILPKMTVETTDVKFSYDTDDKGYPVWAEVTWSGCKTLEVATVQQMPLMTGDESDTGEAFVNLLTAMLPEDSTLTAEGKAAIETSGAASISPSASR